MKLSRFILNISLSEKEINITDEEAINKIVNVLRLKKGSQILLSDGNFNESVCEIESILNNSVKVKVLKVLKNTAEPEVKTILYLSILKRENFEWAVQKSVECGINKIIPLLCDRTVKIGLNQNRLEKIAKAAAEQSGRGIIPEIAKPIKFKEAILQSKNKTNLLFDKSVKNLLSSTHHPTPIGFWIGPEGGWSDKELELAKEAGFRFVSLGKLTLRAETASIVASYFLSNSFLP